MMKPSLFLILLWALCASKAVAQTQPAPPNYDEDKVPAYTLPDPLICNDATRVTNAKVWAKKRRPELLKLFEEQVYGRVPKTPPGLIRSKVISLCTNALGHSHAKLLGDMTSTMGFIALI